MHYYILDNVDGSLAGIDTRSGRRWCEMMWAQWRLVVCILIIISRLRDLVIHNLPPSHVRRGEIEKTCSDVGTVMATYLSSKCNKLQLSELMFPPPDSGDSSWHSTVEVWLSISRADSPCLLFNNSLSPLPSPHQYSMQLNSPGTRTKVGW